MIRVAGHFGEWLQGLHGGQVVLVTMACPALGLTTPGPRHLFPQDVLTRFCTLLGLTGPIPGVTPDMPPGGGAGASTAALVAVARALGFTGTPETLARACLEVEGACDPLMFPAPDTLLWASRAARVVADLPSPPACTVVGGFWGAPTRTDAADHAFPDISDLVADWAKGPSLRTAAALATQSATRCTALRGPSDPMADLARDLNALGVVRAHTGSARGLIFATGEAPAHAESALCEAGLTDTLTFATGGAP